MILKSRNIKQDCKACVLSASFSFGVILFVRAHTLSCEVIFLHHILLFSNRWPFFFLLARVCCCSECCYHSRNFLWISLLGPVRVWLPFNAMHLWKTCTVFWLFAFSCVLLLLHRHWCPAYSYISVSNALALWFGWLTDLLFLGLLSYHLYYMIITL